ncbi:MAG: hypothetical protein H6588_07745 [Flavobacteriales bacterium]|nr:hypothetical protein [Flavobacteriales bacterium]
MKKIISIALLFATITVNAQSTAKAEKINGKEIFVLTRIANDYTDVGSVHLTSEQIKQTRNLEDRIKIVIANAKTNDYDAIYTRDGVTARLIKYNENVQITEGVLPVSFKKDAYLFSLPTKEFTVVKSKVMTLDDVHLSFNKIISTYIENAQDLTYDALLITKDKVEYIIYK